MYSPELLSLNLVYSSDRHRRIGKRPASGMRAVQLIIAPRLTPCKPAPAPYTAPPGASSCRPSVQALAAILRSKRVTSAMTRSSIVDLLRAMLQGTRGGGRGASLAPPPMRPGATALTEALFRTVSDAGVVPALMVAYRDADAVEGLDVDKYHFDKFTMRHNVDAVLRELWQDEQCLKDLLQMAAPGDSQCGPLSSLLRMRSSFSLADGADGALLNGLYCHACMTLFLLFWSHRPELARPGLCRC